MTKRKLYREDFNGKVLIAPEDIFDEIDRQIFKQVVNKNYYNIIPINKPINLK
jgi:hypothetical protein